MRWISYKCSFSFRYTGCFYTALVAHSLQCKEIAGDRDCSRAVWRWHAICATSCLLLIEAASVTTNFVASFQEESFRHCGEPRFARQASYILHHGEKSWPSAYPALGLRLQQDRGQRDGHLWASFLCLLCCCAAAGAVPQESAAICEPSWTFRKKWSKTERVLERVLFLTHWRWQLDEPLSLNLGLCKSCVHHEGIAMTCCACDDNAVVIVCDACLWMFYSVSSDASSICVILCTHATRQCTTIVAFSIEM